MPLVQPHTQSSRGTTIARLCFTVGLFAVVVGALVIRLWGVHGKGLWNDEIISVTVRAPELPGFVLSRARILNLWLLKFILAYTRNETLLRLPNILGSTLAVVCLGVWMRRAFGRAEGLLAAACLAITPRFILHTCLCRSYGLLAGFLVLAMWAAWEWCRRPQRWWWLCAWAAAGAAIFLARPEGLSVLAVVAFLMPGLAFVHRPFTPSRLALIALAYVVVYAAICYAGIAFLATRPTLDALLRTRTPLLAHAGIATTPLYIGLGVLGVLDLESLRFALRHTFLLPGGLWFLVVLLTLGVAAMCRRAWRLVPVVLAWIVIGHTGVEFITTQVQRIPFDARHIQMCTPAWIMLFVAGATSVGRWTARLRHPRLQRCALLVGGLWALAALAFFAGNAGTETIRFITYDRIADWKHIAALSHAAADAGAPFDAYGHGFELGYYRAASTPDSLHSTLSSLSADGMLFYLPGRPEMQRTILQLPDHDAAWLPYEPHPVFAIFPSVGTTTSYWSKASAALALARQSAGRHAQLHEAHHAARLLAAPRVPSRRTSDIDVARTRRVRCGEWHPLIGWGHIESLDRTRYRWSIQHRCALQLPRYRGRLARLAVEGMPFMPDEAPVRMRVHLGHVLLGDATLTAGWHRYVLRVPPAVPAGERRLQFHFRTPQSPAQAGLGGDTRFLAFALGDVSMDCIPRRAPAVLELASAAAEPYLGPHWSHAEQWPDGRSLRWLTGATGTVAWGAAPAGTWHVTLLPFVMPGRTQQVTFVENGIALTNVALQPAWATYDVVSLRTGTFNRVLTLQAAYAVAPSELGMGSDPRPLSCAVEEIARRPAP